MLEIPDSLLDEIRQHGARTYPNECCGALLGRQADDGTRTVQVLLALDNRREGEAARTRFLITAEDVLHAMREARARGLDIIGYYHSHPDHPARPSAYDREHAWPGYSYIIVAVAHGEPQDATSWVLTDDRSRFLPEPMRSPAASNS
jgi:proteasome lid subunit RPN8/RPN11